MTIRKLYFFTMLFFLLNGISQEAKPQNVDSLLQQIQTNQADSLLRKAYEKLVLHYIHFSVDSANFYLHLYHQRLPHDKTISLLKMKIALASEAYEEVLVKGNGILEEVSGWKNARQLYQLYYLMAQAYKEVGKSDLAFNFSGKAFEQLLIDGRRDLEASWYNLQGGLFNSVGENAKAIEHFHKAIKIREGLNSLKYNELKGLGTVYHYLKNTDSSAYYFKLAYHELGDKPENTNLRVDALSNLSEYFMLNAQLDSAFHYRKKILEIGEVYPLRSSDRCMNCLRLANLYGMSADVDRQHTWLKKAKTVCSQVESPSILANYYNELGMFLTDLAPDSANWLFQKAQILYEQIGDAYSSSVVHYSLARINTQQNKLDSALWHIDKSIEQATAVGYIE